MKIATLEDVCYLNMGQSPDSSTYNEVGEGLPFYQGNADFGEKHPHCRVWCSEPTKIAEKEDILISVRAPIGALNEANERCCIGRGVAAIRPKEKINKDFLYYFLLSKKSYLISKGTGSTFKAISKNVLRELSIPVPSLHEQEKRARILNTLWWIIYTRRAQLSKLDELVKCRFVELFIGKSYPRRELQTLIQEGTSISYGIVQPGDDGTGNIGLLRPVDFHNGAVILDNLKYIGEAISNLSRKTILEGNELLITVRGTTGLTALTNSNHRGMNVTRGIAVVRYDGSKIVPEYLQAFMDSDESQTFISEHTRGATLQQINLSDLRSQSILVPPYGEQQSFAAFVRRIDKLRMGVQAALDKAQTLFDSLMQEYFG